MPSGKLTQFKVVVSLLPSIIVAMITIVVSMPSALSVIVVLGIICGIRLSDINVFVLKDSVSATVVLVLQVVAPCYLLRLELFPCSAFRLHLFFCV